MRPAAPLRLLLAAILLAGCSKPATNLTSTETSTTTASATATDTSATASSTTDNRTAAEKAMGAGLRARDKAELLKREADAKAKEADATNE